MGEAEMEDEYVRLLTLARQRRDEGILSPDDYKAEKTRLAEMRDGWIRRRVFRVSRPLVLSPSESRCAGCHSGGSSDAE